MVAALFVFGLHSSLPGFFGSQSFAGKYASVVYQGAWAAVSFFFILSGFVLTWAAHPSDTTGQYYRRRILKIYPNNLVTAGVAAALMFWVAGRNLGTGADSSGPLTVVSNFLLVQSWSPDWMVRTALDPPAWSLSVEVFFYALFPLLFALIRRIRPERLWAWTAGVAGVAVVGVPVVAGTVIPHEAIVPDIGLSLEQFWFVVQFPPTRALEFVLGMLLAQIVITGRRLPVSLGGALAWTVAAYATASLFPAVVSMNALLLIPIGLLVASLAVTDAERKHTWLSSKLMVKLGEISFAFYLWHMLVLMYAAYWLGNKSYSTPVALALIAGLFGIALLLSYLQFTFVENPIMRKWSRSRRKAPVLEPVAVRPPTEFKRAS